MTIKELCFWVNEAINYAKIRNVKTHLTLNTLIKENELSEALNIAKKAYEQIEKENDSLKFGVGIEAGMYPVEEASTQYMDCSICSIYDGRFNRHKCHNRARERIHL